LARLKVRGVIGGNVIHQIERLKAADLDFAHVADVEQSDTLSYGMMFFEQAGVLDGHIPPAEIDHLGAQAAMNRIQRRGFQWFPRLRHETSD